jgi:hypothetical protein
VREAQALDEPHPSQRRQVANGVLSDADARQLLGGGTVVAQEAGRDERDQELGLSFR